jgi:hypothetical protein
MHKCNTSEKKTNETAIGKIRLVKLDRLTYYVCANFFSFGLISVTDCRVMIAPFR